MQSIDNALEKLSKSKFRSSFHLKAKDIAYIDEKGMDTVRRHAEDFIEKKLAPAVAGVALKNGIKYQREESLQKRSRKK